MLGVSLLGPTLIAYGTEAQKQRFLAKILGADEIDDLERGRGIDSGAAGIAPFGQAHVEVVVSHTSRG